MYNSANIEQNRIQSIYKRAISSEPNYSSVRS